MAVGRRQFISALGGTALAWPLAARAQQPSLPVIGVVSGRSPEADARSTAAFYKGLNENGYVQGQNVTVEYHWLEGQYHRLPVVMADLVRRQVSVIATTAARPLRSQPRQRPRRSRLYSVSEKTLSSSVLSLASPDPVATRPASMTSSTK